MCFYFIRTFPTVIQTDIRSSCNKRPRSDYFIASVLVWILAQTLNGQLKDREEPLAVFDEKCMGLESQTAPFNIGVYHKAKLYSLHTVIMMWSDN